MYSEDETDKARAISYLLYNRCSGRDRYDKQEFAYVLMQGDRCIVNEIFEYNRQRPILEVASCALDKLYAPKDHLQAVNNALDKFGWRGLRLEEEDLNLFGEHDQEEGDGGIDLKDDEVRQIVFKKISKASVDQRELLSHFLLPYSVLHSVLAEEIGVVNKLRNILDAWFSGTTNATWNKLKTILIFLHKYNLVRAIETGNEPGNMM